MSNQGDRNLSGTMQSKADVLMASSLGGGREEVQLISTEVQEIISYRPHWIIRRGNLFFFFILLGVLFGSWLIKYPDMVKGSLRIAAVDGPKSVTAKTEGNLIKLLVKNEATVKEGEPLAYIQSTGAHDEVFQLKNWIHAIEQPVSNESIEVILNYPLPILNNLGELQPDYEIFRLQLKETMQILQSGYYIQKKQTLFKDITYLQQLKANLAKQNELLKKEYDVQKVDFNAKDGLAKEKVIAPLELNQEKGKMLLKEQGLEQMTAQLINSNIASHNKQKELLELQKFTLDQRLKFQSALFSLKSKTSDWLRRFVLTAPQAGKLFYGSFVTENQLVGAGTELFYVQPGKSSYFGLLTAGQNGIGKIYKDQDVIIRVQGYPSEQFGYLKGKVTYISNLPNRSDSFLIRVELPKDLITNHQHKLQFRNNLLATAEVITKERRLLERFTGQLADVLRR
jgi:multidrug resistance efflux pump